MSSKLPSFNKWMLQYVMGLVPVVLLVFLLVPHLLFEIPVRFLTGLCVSVAVVMLIFAPLIYFTNRHGRRSGNWKPAFIVVGFTAEVMCLVLFHYAFKFGVLSLEVAQGSVIATAVGLPVALSLNYRIGRKLFPDFFRPRDNSGPS